MRTSTTAAGAWPTTARAISRTPNTTSPKADYKFWTDETKVPEQFKVFLETARKNLTPNLDRMHFFKDGEEILPGVQAIYAPGHTVGHTVFMIDQGGQQLCYVGDLAHHPVLLLEKPLTEFKYDTDPSSRRSRA